MTSVGDHEVDARRPHTLAPREVATAVLLAAPVPVVIVEGDDDTITLMNEAAAGRLGAAALGRSLHELDCTSATDGATEVLLDSTTATRLVFLVPDTSGCERIELANRLHDQAIPAAMAVGLRIELARGLAAPESHTHLEHAAAILAELSTYLRAEMHLLAGEADTPSASTRGAPGTHS